METEEKFNQEIGKEPEKEKKAKSESSKKPLTKHKIKRLPVRILKKVNYFHRKQIIFDKGNSLHHNTKILSRFVNKQGQIVPQTFSELTRNQQKLVAISIKRARQMKLMPYIIIEQKIY